jgi:DNA-binding LacI/PurR family transcriptional regulator
MPKHVTLRDVADYAGVSITTVSNVVRDWPYVSQSMRERVKEAIAKLGYSPHVVAQGLRTGQTQVLAFVVPDLSNPYFAEIVAVAEDIARQYGYTLLVFNSHEDADREAECVQRAASRWADGLLISHTTKTRHSSEFWAQFDTPVVAVDRIPADYSGPQCALDNRRAGELATLHLIELGHQHIAHIAGPQSARPAVDRQAGYQQALADRGIPWQRILYTSDLWGPTDGYQLTSELLQGEEIPTAIFASNDRVAIGALHAITDQGLRVPEDISLVGVDDIEISEHLNPPLTTIHQPLDHLSQQAVEMLIGLIRDEPPPEVAVLLEPELIVRRSTARPRTEATSP